jgi:hypothetical protein
MSDTPKTRFDRFVERAKDHRVVSVLLLVGMVVGSVVGIITGILAVTGAIRGPTPDLSIERVEVIQDTKAVVDFRSRWPGAGLNSTELAAPEAFRPGQAVNHFPLIDIVLRNNGKAPSFVHSLILDISMRQSDDHGLLLCSPLAPTWNYSAAVKPFEQKQRLYVELAQKVAPQDLDRFVVVLGAEYGAPHYDLRLSIRHDLNVVTTLGDFTVKHYDAPCGIGRQSQSPVIPLSSRK